MDRAFGPEEVEREHAWEMEMMNGESRMTNDELPNGWELIKLQDVASWGSGGTPPRKNPKYYGGEIPWIKTGELGDGLILDTEEKITAAGLKNSSAKVFPKGSVAIAMYGATIGKVSILGIDAATNQACAVGIPDLRVTGPQYLFQYLRSQKDAFIAAGKGGAQPNLSQGVIKEWPLPLAPLAEQKRIADKLESVLGRVDACRARLDRVPALVKRFRQSVLAAATSGKLTEEWRQVNGVNDEWENFELGDLVTEMKNGLVAKQTKEAVGIPMSRIETIADGTINPERIGYSTEVTLKQAEPFRLKFCDILFSHINSAAHLGKTAIYRGIPATLFHGMNLMLLRADDEKVSSVFLELSLRHLRGESVFSMVAQHAVNQASINQKKLRAIEIAVPSLPEQQEIVRRVEALFAFADRIEARLATAQKTVERLTPATLAKAFRGELVPQDPNDEPATTLLEQLESAKRERPATKTRRERSKTA
ncbi:MAG: restriction endonuclease subunit S [Akkermansiaceae bacterium]|jgi:type I restriction enzyme S subunit|nr:restriction endonuclease subunit S [Akkermansiaceae bacterium]